jgi:hypothetical protein
MVSSLTGASSSSPPTMACAGLPHPRSRIALAAATRAAGGAADWFMTPTRVLIAVSVCDLAKDRISVGAFAI